jgi:predicted alpha-1,2-mannosidase
MRKKITLAVLLAAASALARGQVAAHVDPLLGNDGGGNTFPGPSLPFGMIKPGPDMGANDGNAGWKPIVSGTGGGCKYGNILVQPTVGAPQASGYGSAWSGEQAGAGYYRVTLSRYPVDVEITTARRTAMYRFTYPATGRRNVLFDVSHLLSSYANQTEGQTLVGSGVRIVSPTEVAGSTTVTGGWNKQTTNYTVFFYAATDTPAKSWGTWDGAALHDGSQQQTGTGSGAWLTFAGGAKNTLLLKVGISFVSEAQAKQNATAEIAGFDFEGTRAKAMAAWDKALSPIQLKGVGDADQQVFYTALYHTMLMPVDRTGENPLWQSSEPYYDDFYTLWDTFRTSGPLLTLIAEDRQAQMVRALVDIFRHDGWLPDGRSGNFNGRTQGGSDAEFVIADAYLKGLPGIDWETAYRAMVKDAETTPPDQMLQGRGDLADWKTLGYLSIEGVDRPASKQMEYAANDYEVAVMAKALHRRDDYAKYKKRSENWELLWDDEAKDGGFSGFIWSRHRDGSWKAPFDPKVTGTWGSDTFYEGNAWTYSTFVPQDNARLIARSGGREQFVQRMDAFFAVPGRYDVGNEPGFLAPYLYLWAGRQDRTADQIRNILEANFHAGRSGIPGNDDSGAMSSWYAFGKMGIYPNAGQDVYVIGSPAYPEMSIHLANGKVFTIEAKNVSAENRYIERAEWDGQPYNKVWFRHADIERGGRLVLTMSAKPSSWGSGSVPPSLSAEAP